MLKMPRFIREAIITHAREGLPLEVCGILGGKADTLSEVYRIRNTKTSQTRFQMDPRGQIAAMDDLERRGLDLLAFYHSHPVGPSCPSEEDVRLAYYPDMAAIIIYLEDREDLLVGAFLIKEKTTTSWMCKIPAIIIHESNKEYVDLKLDKKTTNVRGCVID